MADINKAWGVLMDMQNYLNNTRYEMFSSNVVVDRAKMQAYLDQLYECLGAEETEASAAIKAYKASTQGNRVGILDMFRRK